MGVSPDPESPFKTREERRLEAQAVQALAEYRLVKDGVATYAALGYGLPGINAGAAPGGVPAIKTLEYLAIDNDMAEALEDRRERDRQRG